MPPPIRRPSAKSAGVTVRRKSRLPLRGRSGSRAGLLSNSDWGSGLKSAKFAPPDIKEKPPEGGSHTSWIANQAAIAWLLSLRDWRYATKPTPAKPKSIIAQVDDSGTAATELTANSKLFASASEKVTKVNASRL